MATSAAAIAAEAGRVIASTAQDTTQYLTFALGREVFALGILGIKEILEYTPPTDVPMMPACIRGVVNLRGAAVPVVDLYARFGRPSVPVTKKTCIVIVETALHGQRHVFGVLVDSVNEVVEIAPADIEPPPSFGTSVGADFIRGMGKVRGKFVIILDVERALSIDDFQVVAGSRVDAGDASEKG
jgi:purine-binding chemotaxis protein CheW